MEAIGTVELISEAHILFLPNGMREEEKRFRKVS